MITIKTVCAIMHTPLDIVLVGTYDNVFAAKRALEAAAQSRIKENPVLSLNEISLDWFDLEIGGDANYKITNYEEMRDRWDNSAYGDDDDNSDDDDDYEEES